MFGVRALLLRVFGRVQRVGYRRYVLTLARRLGLAGWVKNLVDDTVEVFVQGPEDKLPDFLRMVKEPPPPALVEKIDVKDSEVQPELKHFRIIYGELAEELQEGFGAMQAIFMDYWKEFRDYRKEFRDYREEFRDFREEFRDFRGEFQDYRKEFQDFREEFRGFREEFRDYREEFREFARRTDENFKVVLERYGEISERLARLIEEVREENRRLREMLEEIRREARESREALKKSLELLSRVVEKFLEKG